ncbi:MAG: cytochrome c biogenesis protein [Thermoleophilaceae bacterium]
MRGVGSIRRLRGTAIASAATLAVAGSLIFFWVPNEADQGFVQKIFYLHVPLAIVALCGFIAGGVFGALHLRSGERRWDVRSYVTIHLSIVFALGVLITGSIWARASWGHWWVWNEPMLVSFLIVFLLYCCYQPLRFAIEDPERQARYASVFALVAGAFVPVNFVAVRLAQAYTHPRVLTETGGNMPGDMRLTFVVALAGIALLYATFWQLEIALKGAKAAVRRARRLAAMPDPEAPAPAARRPSPSARGLATTMKEVT